MKKRVNNDNFSLTELPVNYNYNGIDIMKFICAILVCMIHIEPIPRYLFSNSENINYYLQNCLCRIAVPFYFVCAGFFLFRKININKIDTKIIKEYCFKILRLLGIWTLLLLDGQKYQLWYLGGLVIAILLLTILLKNKVRLKYIIIISIALFLIGLLGDSYYGFIGIFKKVTLLNVFIKIYETIFKTTRNGLFFGTIFVLIGIVFAHKKIIINNKTAHIGLIISICLLFIESFLLKTYSHPKDYNMLISLIPTSFFLFYTVSHIKLKDDIIYKKIRIIGMLLFYLHLLVNYYVNMGILVLRDYLNLDFSSFRFLLVIFITLLISLFIAYLSENNKFKWLKYFYS